MCFIDVYKMAFDWITQNYYFVDDAREMIFVCRSELDLCRSVVDSELSKPRGLALDPTQGFMFFTVWGTSKTGLDRALLDGSERTPLVNKKIVYPCGVTVDLPTKHVYWVDKFLDSVERVDYNGQNRRTIYRGVRSNFDIKKNYAGGKPRFFVSWCPDFFIFILNIDPTPAGRHSVRKQFIPPNMGAKSDNLLEQV